jgi:hypothetical protein
MRNLLLFSASVDNLEVDWKRVASLGRNRKRASLNMKVCVTFFKLMGDHFIRAHAQPPNQINPSSSSDSESDIGGSLQTKSLFQISEIANLFLGDTRSILPPLPFELIERILDEAEFW